jgi:hypothetical protein
MKKSNFRNPQDTKLDTYDSISKVPIDEEKRRCTDVLCIIIGVGLTLALAVLGVITFNKPHYLK